MSPHYSNFLKKPPLSNLSSNCSESVSVTIKIIKHKTQSAKPVGLTPLWGSVRWFKLTLIIFETKTSFQSWEWCQVFFWGRGHHAKGKMTLYQNLIFVNTLNCHCEGLTVGSEFGGTYENFYMAMWDPKGLMFKQARHHADCYDFGRPECWQSFGTMELSMVLSIIP